MEPAANQKLIRPRCSSQVALQLAAANGHVQAGPQTSARDVHTTANVFLVVVACCLQEGRYCF